MTDNKTHNQHKANNQSDSHSHHFYNKWLCIYAYIMIHVYVHVVWIASHNTESHYNKNRLQMKNDSMLNTK